MAKHSLKRAKARQLVREVLALKAAEPVSDLAKQLAATVHGLDHRAAMILALEAVAAAAKYAVAWERDQAVYESAAAESSLSVSVPPTSAA